jgi:hypothetical protein
MDREKTIKQAFGYAHAIVNYLVLAVIVTLICLPPTPCGTPPR